MLTQQVCLFLPHEDGSTTRALVDPRRMVEGLPMSDAILARTDECDECEAFRVSKGQKFS